MLRDGGGAEGEGGGRKDPCLWGECLWNFQSQFLLSGGVEKEKLVVVGGSGCGAGGSKGGNGRRGREREGTKKT